MNKKISEMTRVEFGIPWGCTKAWSYINWYCWIDSRCLRRYKRKYKKQIAYERRCEA